MCCLSRIFVPIWLATFFDHCLDADIFRGKLATRWTILNIYNADFWEFQYRLLLSFRTESMIKKNSGKVSRQINLLNTKSSFQISDFKFHFRFQISEFPKQCNTEWLCRNCMKTLYSKSIQTLYKRSMFFLRHQPRNFDNVRLVAHRRKHFRDFLAIYLVAQLSPKRGILVHKNSVASCQRCRHSVEPRALTCPFKQSDLIAWSLLSWHPRHK